MFTQQVHGLAGACRERPDGLLGQLAALDLDVDLAAIFLQLFDFEPVLDFEPLENERRLLLIGKDVLNLSQFWNFGRDLVELSADLVRSGRVETGALSVNIFWSGRVGTGQAISQSF